MSPSMMILLGGILLLGLLVQLYMMRRNKRGIEAFLAKHPDAVRVRLASSLVDSLITGSVSVDAVDDGETPVLTNDGLKVILLLAPGTHQLHLSTQYNTVEMGKARTKVSPSSLLTVTVEAGHSYTLSTRRVETFAYELSQA
nr:hypothetical protein [uncultured Porphyromonas sp.]